MSDPAWLAVARQEVGIREKAGRAINPRIKEYYEKSGHPRVKDDAVPWCSAFANWVMVEAGYRGTMSLAARSWLSWGKPTKPKPGAILVFKRGTAEWQGHVGFYVGESATHYEVLGGNQRDGVNIASYAKSTLLGARWPSSFATSRTVAVQALAATSSVIGTTAAVVQETTEHMQPVVQQATSVWQWAVYASLGLAFMSALATLWFRWQAVKDGKT